MENEEIPIYNDNGNIRMGTPTNNNGDTEMFYEYKSPSNKSRYKSDSSDDEPDNFSDNPKENWTNEGEVRNTLEMEEGLYGGSGYLNDSQFNGTENSGIINELVVPEFSKEDFSSKKKTLTHEEIKQQFMKNNYQSNFSMGGGYDELDEGERKYQEFTKQMNG